jgi:tetratricopeptide (TPR) repeat protein
VPDDEVDSLDAFGALLRQVRRENGVSLRALGLMVHYSKGHLSKIENGVASASIDFAEACDKALQAGGRLTAAFLADMSRAVPAAAGALSGALFDIPPSPRHFVGRAGDVAEVVTAILGPGDSHRAAVVLIHGMPGIGKTALAVAAAHAARNWYPGGCLFADFGSADTQRSLSAIQARLLRRLGIAAEAIPAEPDEIRALYLSVLYRRPVLIVADDVTTSDQVTALVSASPACAVIATSRCRLDALDDSHQILVRPLGTGDAVALFRAVCGRADIGSDADLARIAAACGGVPLALRVAAAKFRESGHGAAELADCLERPGAAWAELDDGERSVQRVLDSAFGALPHDGQRTLAMLGVHPSDSADSHAIAWLSGTSVKDVAAEFAGLYRRGLITVRPDGRADTNGLVRTFAENAASQLDEQARAEALGRLVAGYAQTAAAADCEISPLRFQPSATGSEVAVSPVPVDDLTKAMAWCHAEVSLIPRICSVAFDLGLDAQCWRLAHAMRGYFFTVKAFGPWIASHRIALLAARRCGDLWAQAVTRNNLGMAYIEQGKIAAAETHYRRALELMRAVGDRRGEATTLGHQAWASHAAGQHDAALSLARQAITLNLGYDDRRSVAIMDRTAALACLNLGRHREALRHLIESQDILSELGLPLDIAMTLNGMGEVHCAMRDLDQAEAFHTLAAERSIACGGRGEQARAVRGLAVTARAAGAEPRAEELYQRAAALYANFDPVTAARLATASRP